VHPCADVNQFGTEERETGLIWDLPRARAKIGAIKRKSPPIATLSELGDFSYEDADPPPGRLGYFPVAK
jgi:hypothetical protein